MSEQNTSGFRSIRTKILVCSFLLGILPLVVAGILTVARAYRSAATAEGQILQGSAEQVMDKIDRMLFERFGDVQAFAFHPAALGTAEEITAAANFYMQAYGTYDLMVLADESGQIIAANTVDPNGKPVDTKALIGLSVKNEPWFKECISGAVKAGDSYAGDLIADPLVASTSATQGLSLNFSAPVFNAEGKPVRVWSNRASWERTSRDLLAGLDKALKSRGAKGVEIMMISKDSRILETFPNSKVGAPGGEPSIQLPPLKADAGYFSANSKGGEEVVAYRKSLGIQAYKGHGWTLMVREPASDVMMEPRHLKDLFVILVVVSAVAVWLVASWIAGSIAAPLVSALAALEKVAFGDLTPRLNSKGSDETARLSNALDSALESVSATLQQVANSAQTLAGAASELSAISTQLNDTSLATVGQARAVDAASTGVGENVSSVAAATEEMAVSIREISKNANEATHIAGHAVGIAETALSAVGKLSDNSAQIGRVSDTINKIAKQTNLLALNATIEAARAGEAGKGFAVVADEVKALANATASATLEIEKQIHQVQEDTTEVSKAIAEISEIINKISEFQSSIAAAVEEQGVTTDSMSRTIKGAADSAAEISASIGRVAASLDANAGSSAQTNEAAMELSKISESLQSTLSQFRL